ncbi:23S rRNA (adenine(2503)-C(2))-methyltransferase RlmN [Bacteroidota bacterium]
MEKVMLFGRKLDELKEIVKKLGLTSFTSKQISEWLYRKQISSFDEMTNLSKEARSKLNDNFEIGLNEPVKVEISEDGTKKYLFKTSQEKYIETVFIPDNERGTLCVSSQAGCKMGCEFCMTGKQGFQGNLTSGEILNQLVSIPERKIISNIVYMGMGEPLDNIDNVLSSLEILTSDYGMQMSPRRITVSTIGIIDGLTKFIDKSDCHLAVSIHNPFNEERKSLVPVQQTNPITEIINIIKKYDWRHQRRVSFEYIMFKGLNDTDSHLNRLIRLLSNIFCRVNLIYFHEIPNVAFKPSDESTMIKFRDGLNKKEIICTIRKSRGQDISAACGMLSTKVFTGK